MDMDNKPMLNDDPNVTLTIRLIMQGKEVGSIIGKKGEIVKRFREESGAKINISDGSCPERIVTVTGPTNAIFKAFTLICKKFEEFQDMNSGGGGSGVPRPPITLRLIVPASQCGSLIGKGGSKIKEIREVTGASIQVASEMLPNSTERAVTISGTGEAITQCIYHICCVMLESPPKGATIPYRPKPQVGGPVILAGGQAYTIQGNYAVPAHSDVSSTVMAPLYHGPPPAAHPPLTPLPPPPLGPPGHLHHGPGGHPLAAAVAPSAASAAAALIALDPLKSNGHLQAALPPPHFAHMQDLESLLQIGGIGKSPLAGLAALGLGGLAPANTGGLNPAAFVGGHSGSLFDEEAMSGNASLLCCGLEMFSIMGYQSRQPVTLSQGTASLAALAGSQLRTSNSRNQQNSNQQTHEMTVPNELIGCIIGKGGTKIAEIRQISGAMIRISNCDDRESGSTDRTITITGNPDAVALAQYLINMSVELQKANLEAQNSPSTGGSGPGPTPAAASPLASAIPLAQLLTKPGALNALSSLSALGGLTELLGAQAGAPPVQTTGVHRTHKSYAPRLRSPSGSGGPSESSKLKSDRNKFSPY